MKSMTSYRTDIKTLCVFQQDVRAYAGNFIYAGYVVYIADEGDRMD